MVAFAEPAEVARRLAIAEAARVAADRPPLSCALYTFVLPVPSRREAEAWLAPEARALGTTPGALMRWLRTTGIVAPPDEVRAALEAHGAAGVTDAVLVLPSRVPPEALEALAEATLPPAPPHVRGAAAQRAHGAQPGDPDRRAPRQRGAGRGAGRGRRDRRVELPANSPTPPRGPPAPSARRERVAATAW